MIAKAKAISHGKIAIEYAMREAKGAKLIATNIVQSDTPESIYEEFCAIQKYNTRCQNKFIRIEIGIAPQDEAKLSEEDLLHICNEFSKRMGLDKNQWIACTHHDTDNLHIHLIANRIGLNMKVYDASFVSNKASYTAEMISREMGLTIANDIKAKRKQPDIVSFERLLLQTKVNKIAHNVLDNKNPSSLKQFKFLMKQEGVSVLEAKNRKGNTYGLRFSCQGETFKASKIGAEFGLRTLLLQLEQNGREEKISIHHNQHLDNSDNDYPNYPTDELIDILMPMENDESLSLGGANNELPKKRKR